MRIGRITTVLLYVPAEKLMVVHKSVDQRTDDPGTISDPPRLGFSRQ
jgi:hypothetical protein